MRSGTSVTIARSTDMGTGVASAVGERGRAGRDVGEDVTTGGRGESEDDAGTSRRAEDAARVGPVAASTGGRA